MSEAMQDFETAGANPSEWAGDRCDRFSPRWPGWRCRCTPSRWRPRRLATRRSADGKTPEPRDFQKSYRGRATRACDSVLQATRLIGTALQSAIVSRGDKWRSMASSAVASFHPRTRACATMRRSKGSRVQDTSIAAWNQSPDGGSSCSQRGSCWRIRTPPMRSYGSADGERSRSGSTRCRCRQSRDASSGRGPSPDLDCASGGTRRALSTRPHHARGRVRRARCSVQPSCPSRKEYPEVSMQEVSHEQARCGGAGRSIVCRAMARVSSGRPIASAVM